MNEEKQDTQSHVLPFASNSVIDEGDGIITFQNGLTITDESTQWNDTRYDIASMDLSTYKGILTADHTFSIQEVIGKTFGIAKEAGRISIQGIKFAVKENALARYAYDMIKGGFLTDFSIETMGPAPDKDGVYFNSQLVGLSLVVLGNNKSAQINEIAYNSIKRSNQEGLDTQTLCDLLKKDGLDAQSIEDLLLDPKGGEYKNMSNKTKNDAEQVVEEQPVEEVVEEVEAEETEEVVEEPVQAENNVAVDAINALTAKIEALEKTAYDNAAKEPTFKKVKNAKAETNARLADTDYKERAEMQINAVLAKNSPEAYQTLREVNEFHVVKLKEEGLVPNQMTISDFGNFVISPELLRDIEGHRSSFKPFLNTLNFKETLSLQMSWLTRSGDIDMTSVEMCDDGADGNLKPISTYTGTTTTKDLEELAAVTPVCNAATRFLAVDLLGDVAEGYRLDYDRKLSQLAVAEMQIAVNATGNKVAYNKTSSATALQSFVDVWGLKAEEIMNGTFIFSQQTYAELIGEMIAAGANGPYANLFTTGDQPTILGRPYIIVPNELMPSLNTGGTKTFTVGGASVTIDQAVFYYKPEAFKGRVSGGLQYDLSTEAAYEIDGSVRSAYQRNELVLRGSFFRGGAITDTAQVASMYAAGIS